MTRALPICLFALGLLVSGPAFAADDETYTLKIYKGKKGDKRASEKTEESKVAIVTTIGGKVNKQDVASGKKDVYTEEILEKKEGDKKATKLTRTYTVAEKTEKGETTKAVYEGETVLIEKKGDAYQFTVKGKALKEDEAPELFKSFNKKEDEPQSEDFLPKGAVKVGDSWKVAADITDKMFKQIGDDKLKVDAKKSTVSGKLLKAYKKGAAQYGVIELTIDVIVTDIDLGGQFAPTKPGSKMVMVGTIDTCIDGSEDAEDGKMTVSVDIATEIPNAGSLTISSVSKIADKAGIAK